MSHTSSLRNAARSFIALLACLTCASEAHGADSYDGVNLTIPTLMIGSATYTDLVVTPGSIISGPSGDAPNGSGDLYNPASNQLTIQEVSVGESTYFNVVITVGKLISIGAVNEADIYDGKLLSIGEVEVLGQSGHSNVVVTILGLDRIEGGMPALAEDEYIPETGQLIIPAVEAFGQVYTNVIVTVGNILSAGGGALHNYAMGNGSGDTFVDGAIAIASGTLSAGGRTGIALSIVDEDNLNSLDTSGEVTVSFTSPCLADGEAQILPAGSETPTLSIATTTGSINATYVATGCSGTDTIHASATIGNESLAASASLAIASASVGSIQFVSATPASIGLKGTGLNETSTVIFKVLDVAGNPKPGVVVNFSLDTSVGGMSLSPTSAVSSLDGTVQTVIAAGTVHTSVRVAATIVSPPISTQSNSVAVTTGLPASNAFSIAPGAPSYAKTGTLACPNVEAFSLDGVSVPLTIRLADRYNNPVPDGTAVTLQADGGIIQGSCTTPISPGDGACLAMWTSANPRPGVNPSTGAIDLTYGYPPGYTPLLAAGRTVILASTIGEESFSDLNGSGFYQAGDPFSNLGDPYEDDNEQGVYQLGDPFIDFYHMGSWTPPSGSFVGIICTGDTAGSTCTTSTLAIGASQLIVMSTGLAQITPLNQTGFGGSPSSGLTIGNGSAGTLVFSVQDLHTNAMPAGTLVSFAFSNPQAGVTLDQTPPVSFACDSSVGGEPFGVTVQTTSGITGSGTLTLTTTSPNGVQTVSAYNLTVQ